MYNFIWLKKSASALDAKQPVSVLFLTCTLLHSIYVINFARCMCDIPFTIQRACCVRGGENDRLQFWLGHNRVKVGISPLHCKMLSVQIHSISLCGPPPCMEIQHSCVLMLTSLTLRYDPSRSFKRIPECTHTLNRPHTAHILYLVATPRTLINALRSFSLSLSLTAR